MRLEVLVPLLLRRTWFSSTCSDPWTTYSPARDPDPRVSIHYGPGGIGVFQVT